MVSGGDKSVCNGMDEKVQMSILRIVNVAGQGTGDRYGSDYPTSIIVPFHPDQIMGGLSPESTINITWRTGDETRGGSHLISKCLLLWTFDYRTIDQSILLDRSSLKKKSPPWKFNL